MAISIRDDAERAALDAILALVSAGSGDASGDFEVLTAGSSSLAVIPFNTTAFGASSTGGGSATASGTFSGPSGTPTPGTIGLGRFRDKANSAVVSFSISASGGGGDMIVTDPVIPSNATAVSCSGVTVTLNVTN